ncbi:MAG TPA: hypothetical protein VIO64_19390 [Pseudobacteroides sp.]|uniref:hypothetical protein n=1 Tax=Pseudobacteroides sp. TaxID=1968840 RepID=UPI002F92BAC3
MNSEHMAMKVDDKEGIQNLVVLMGTAMTNAFVLGDIELFMKWFTLDIVSDYYMRRWFSGYAVKVAQPAKCNFDIESLEKECSDCFTCKVKFEMIYEVHESETAFFTMKVQHNSSERSVKITEVQISLDHPAWKDDPMLVQGELLQEGRIKEHLYASKSKEYLNRKWWEENELADISCESEECLKASIYARAIPKSVRFRNTHPEIDSATVLSDMMSYKAARLAFILKGGNMAASVKKINHFGQEALLTKTYSEVKKEDSTYFPARELSLVPLYNIDETFHLMKSCEKAEISCVDMASFYTSLLRLSGMNPTDIFVVIQPFHYLTILKLPKSYYIISINEIMPMSSKRLYGDTDVTRVVTPAFFLDGEGQTNMPDDLLQEVQQFFKNGIPIFSMPKADEKANVLPLDVESCPTVNEYPTAEELNWAVRKYVFEMSRKYPASPFTWAKYSYQTLLVNQPQAYILWAMNSLELQGFSKGCDSLEQILTWMAESLHSESIFEEADRIMTADQVFRNKTGGHKDKAVFLFTTAKSANLADEGGVIITPERSYVALRKALEKYIVIDSEKLIPVSEIEGNVILAFDDENCFKPKGKKFGKHPAWLEAVV